MKTCNTCQKEKNESEFHSKGNGQIQTKCKLCQSDYSKVYYQSYKNKIKTNCKKNNKVLRIRNKNFVNNYKSERGCSNCNEREPVALDFHHTENNKEDSVARMARSSYSIVHILKEIAKCIILCANCHRKHHAGLL